jgi:hypothetical protein
MKGGSGNPTDLTSNPWYLVAPGDGLTNLVDFNNSNTVYYIATKTLNAGLLSSSILTGSLASPNPTPQPLNWNTLTMDPSNSNTLAMYSGSTQSVSRDTNQGSSWTSISPPSIPGIVTMAIAPSHFPPDPSTMIFAGDGRGDVWYTFDASTWNVSLSPTNGLPVRSITSLAVDPTRTCTGPDCALFTSVSGFGSNHVFRSSNGGASWQTIDGSGSTMLPNMPVNRLVVHPTNGTVLWAATDLGVVQGCTSSDGSTCSSSGTNWIWGVFGAGLPAGILVNDLAIHKDSGKLRAFTFGRSAWEAQAFTPQSPDFMVNTCSPSTDAQFPQISAGTGQLYAVGWIDDRAGLNNPHVFFQGYAYANGQPSALANGGVCKELQADDTTTKQGAQALSISADPYASTPPICARFAWQDNRLSASVSHVYFQYGCTDGFRIFNHDVRADPVGAPDTVNAKAPSITWQQAQSAFAVAWQADRPGSQMHDIYARFYNSLGGLKSGQCGIPGNTNPCKVNTSVATDATIPAATSDASGDVYVSWIERDSSANYSVWLRKYTPDGSPSAMGNRLDAGTLRTVMDDVGIAVDGQTSINGPMIIVTWWQGGVGSEIAVRRRVQLDSSGAIITNSGDPNPVQVNNPPAVPTGLRRAASPGIPSMAVATGANNGFLVVWQGNVNDYANANLWNAFGRSFDSNANTLINDFRIDLAPRTASVQAPKIARGPQSTRFAYAWRDNRRDGAHYDVYSRVP